ncbi:MAG: IreB family regulatory phosphoprotein [Clostridia bacterium]
MTSFTTKIDLGSDKNDEIREILKLVHEALTEKGYNPISQLVGYIMSGDPTYITSHKGARGMITRFERDEILEVVFKDYLNK